MSTADERPKIEIIKEAHAQATEGQYKNPKIPTAVYIDHVGDLLKIEAIQTMRIEQLTQALRQVRARAVSLDDYELLKWCDAGIMRGVVP